MIALDGVAPMAKLGGSRGAAYSKQKDYEKECEAKNIYAFHKSWITPGTSFMTSLSRELKAFINNKVKNDPLYGYIKCIISDA